MKRIGHGIDVVEMNIPEHRSNLIFTQCRVVRIDDNDEFDFAVGHKTVAEREWEW